MECAKQYKENLKKRIITEQMLGDALYSVNKRAKNSRDQIRRYRSIRYFSHGAIEQYEERKARYYGMKDKMLSIVKPDSIHKSTRSVIINVTEDDEEYYSVQQKDVIYENEYYDRDLREYVSFKKINVEKTEYFLFYQLGSYSFHSPIDESEIKNYEKLSVKDIGTLNTRGANIDSMMSVQYAQKVVDLIEAGDFTYISGEK